MNSQDLTYEFPELSPQERLRELILYISDKLKSDPKFGKVKLAKVLYFADIEAYRKHGKSISGSAYTRMTKGPVPQSFYEVLPAMEKERAIEIEKQRVISYYREPVKALQEADLSKFSRQEISIVDEAIRLLLPQNANEVSELSHIEIAWKGTEEFELIPYEASLLSGEPLTPEEIAYGKKLAREHG